MTVGPLAAGAIGVGVIRRYPRRFGLVFGSYTVVAVLLALAPFVLDSAADAPHTVLQPLLREAKVAIAIGAFLIVGASGPWSRRARPSAV